MQRAKSVLAMLGLVFMLAAASVQIARAARAPITNHSDEQRYVLTGTVQSVDVPNHQLTVDGDAVPGYMDAMSMAYSVPDQDTLKTLNVGDIIRADIVVTPSDTHLENIRVTGHKGQ